MAANSPPIGVLIDEAALSVEELARACDFEAEWWCTTRAVACSAAAASTLAALALTRFGSADLVQARRLRSLESVFDANEGIAALCSTLATRSRACARGCGFWPPRGRKPI